MARNRCSKYSMKLLFGESRPFREAMGICVGEDIKHRSTVHRSLLFRKDLAMSERE